VFCFLCFICSAGAKGRFCGGFDINAFGNKPSKNKVLCKVCYRHFQFLKLISFMSPENEKPGSLSIDFLTDIVEGNS
jgi:enoyl-CoA hydratase/3-hydroxyacyl-CoA dehydrogenase